MCIATISQIVTIFLMRFQIAIPFPGSTYRPLKLIAAISRILFCERKTYFRFRAQHLIFLNCLKSTDCSDFTYFRICFARVIFTQQPELPFPLVKLYCNFSYLSELESGDEAGMPELVLTGINFPSKTTLSLKGRFKRIFRSSDESMSSPSYFSSTFI